MASNNENETKQLLKEIDELKTKRLQYERDKVEEVRKLQAEYKAKGKATVNEAGSQIRPVAEKRREQVANLNRDLRVEQTKIERDIEEQLQAIRRSKQSRLDKSKRECEKKRDEMVREHKQFTDAVEQKMYHRQQDLELESQIAVETMEQEYDQRISEADEQLSVLQEAVEIDKEEDQEKRKQARDEADKRRKSRQDAEAEARRKKLEDSIKAQGGPLKTKTPPSKKPKSRYASKQKQARQ